MPDQWYLYAEYFCKMISEFLIKHAFLSTHHIYCITSVLIFSANSLWNLNNDVSISLRNSDDNLIVSCFRSFRMVSVNSWFDYGTIFQKNHVEWIPLERESNRNHLHFVPICSAQLEWHLNKPIDWLHQACLDYMWTHRPCRSLKFSYIFLSTNALSPKSIPGPHCLWVGPYSPRDRDHFNVKMVWKQKKNCAWQSV